MMWLPGTHCGNHDSGSVRTGPDDRDEARSPGARTVASQAKLPLVVPVSWLLHSSVHGHQWKMTYGFWSLNPDKAPGLNWSISSSYGHMGRK